MYAPGWEQPINLKGPSSALWSRTSQTPEITSIFVVFYYIKPQSHQKMKGLQSANAVTTELQYKSK